MTFVNIHGKPLDIASLATKKVGKVAAPKESQHKGFQAVGYSPEQTEEAKRRHKADSEFEVQHGRPPLQPFSIDSYTRFSKPKKIEKPKATHEAAYLVCQIAERAGWAKTSVVELKKAGRN